MTVLGQLVPVVYEELHIQARRYLRRERPGHSIEETAEVLGKLRRELARE